MTYLTNEDIQESIDSLPDGRGTVTLDAGLYMINAPVTLPNSVRLRGQGANATRLLLAEGANCDMIQVTGNAPSYYRYCGISDMALYCNSTKYQNPNTEGCGVVLFYAQHCKLSDLYIAYAPEFGIKLLRSFWCTIRDSFLYHCSNGVRIGSHSDSVALMSNSNLSENVHVENDAIGVGIEICAGRTNVLMKCDTSRCAVGVRVANDQDCHCQNNQLYGHYFESNQVDIEQQGEDTWDTRCLYPIFTPHGSTINDETGALYIEGASIYPRESGD